MAESRIRRILASPFRRAKAATTAFTHPASLVSWLLPNSRFNYQRSVGDGTSSSVVMAPLRWLQRNATQAPIRVLEPSEDGKTWTPIPTGDKGAGRMLNLLEMPNPYYHGGVLLKATVLSFALDANAYWRIVRNAVGAPVQLWWIPHTLMSPHRRDGSPNFIDYYKYDAGTGLPEEVPVEDVIHFRDGIDPSDTTKGLNAFKSLLREVFTDDEAATYTASLLRNMGVPGVIMTPKSDEGAAEFGDDLDEVKRKLNATITGDNRGSSMVLDSAVEVHTVGFNPQQMSVRDARRLPEERVTAVLGIPAIVCGLGAGLDRSTFANMSEAREAAVEESLIPIWNEIALVVKHQLLPQFESRARELKVDFDLSEVRVLREDQDKIADRWVRVVQGGLATIGEGREAMGLDVDDSHDVFLRPLQSIEVPAGQTMASITPTIDPAAAPDATGGAKAGRVLSARNASTINAAIDALREVLLAAGIDPDEGGAGKTRWGMLHVADAEVKRLSRAQQGRLIQALELDARALEAPFAKRLEGQFEDLGKHVAALWAAEDAKSRATGDVKATEETDVTPRDLDVALRTLQLAEVTKWRGEHLGRSFKGHYEGVARQTLKTLNATLGIEWGEKTDEIAIRVLQLHGKQLELVDLAGQTKSALFQALADGKAAGEGVQALERRIRQYVTDGSSGSKVSARAMRIARTETMNAQRVSTREAYQASGVYDAVVAWDDRVGYGDPDCVERNGQVFTFDDAEAEEDAEHPNGTLSWAPTTMLGD